jgi:hypothetical protein
MGGCKGFCPNRLASVELSRKNRLGDLDVDGEMLLKWILETYDEMACTGFIWLRIGTSGRVPCVR